LPSKAARQKIAVSKIFVVTPSLWCVPYKVILSFAFDSEHTYTYILEIPSSPAGGERKYPGCHLGKNRKREKIKGGNVIEKEETRR
jgi:hypothetical protein